MKKEKYIRPEVELFELMNTLSILDTLSQPDEFGINDWGDGETENQSEDIYG